MDIIKPSAWEDIAYRATVGRGGEGKRGQGRERVKKGEEEKERRKDQRLSSGPPIRQDWKDEKDATE